LLASEDKGELEREVQAWCDRLERFGLKLNVKKTESKWRSLTGVLYDREIPEQLKSKIYRAVVRPVAMYGAECWPATKEVETRLSVMETKMLRWTAGVTRMDRIRNDAIRQKFGVAPIADKMREARLRWYGYVLRGREDSVRTIGLNFEDLKPVEEEALIRICATDRREQTETSPEILRRRINQTAGKDRWSDLPPPPRQPPYCLRHPDRQLERCARKESKNIRFGMTKSAESVHQVLDARSQESGRVVADSARAPPAPTMTQSNYEGATQSEDGVTLRFRRYKLASTPETTV
uniref:Reverse transcriptase domain-containing protein n=1 Tax=Heligmosomoides polygyrus TaxID=6339 RepID=A0A8L8Q3U7_HELPZ